MTTTFPERIRALYEEMGYEPSRRYWLDQSARKCCPLSIITMDRCLKRGMIGELELAMEGEGSFYMLVSQMIPNSAFLSGFVAGWDGHSNLPSDYLKYWKPHRVIAYDSGWKAGVRVRKEFQLDELND